MSIDAVAYESTHNLDEVVLQPSESTKLNYLGRSITEVDWRVFEKECYEKYCRGESLPGLVTWLNEKGFSHHIHDIHLKSARLLGVNLTNVTFERVNFQKARFEDAELRDVHFIDCDLKNTTWNYAAFEEVIFDKCELDYANFYKASLRKTAITSGALFKSSFVSTLIKDSLFEDVKLEQVSFLSADIDNSTLRNCDLTNALLCGSKKKFRKIGCTEHVIDKPVVAMGWYFNGPLRYAKLTSKVIEDQEGIALLYDHDLEEIDQSKLNEEVKQELQKIKQHGLSPGAASIAQSILSHKHPLDSQIGRIQAYAEDIFHMCDALTLPGGSDVEKVFYDLSSESYESDDYARSIFEFALLEKFNRSEKSIMGTCRGSQITNVFLGGTLKEVGYQDGIENFEMTEPTTPMHQVFKDTMGETIMGMSAHHQASDRIAKGLHVIYQDQEIPKLLTSDDGRIILSQFHPESYIQLKDNISRERAEEILNYYRFWKEKGKMSEEKFFKLKTYIDEYFKNLKKLENNKWVFTVFFDRIKANQRPLEDLQTA